MKYIFLIASALVLSGVMSAQDSITRKLDQLVTAYSKMNKFNGSVLVARHGNILLQKGYGLKNAADHSMNQPGTMFQVASVTKQFTAAVILKLVESGKMALTDKLSKYYAGFLHGDSITINHLLTHTSGLRSFTEEDSSIIETDEKRMVPYLKSLRPDFSPGSAWHYSNSGYVMLGYIIQQVSHMTYWEAVRTFIFEPLQMNSSGFDFAHADNRRRATGYDILSDTMNKLSVLTDSTVPFGAGAIYSTVQDMYKWHLGLQNEKLIGKGLIEKAYTPCAFQNYGYGWVIDSVYGRKMVSHSGSISGFGSNFARIPDDDVCIVLLSNKAGSTSNIMRITNKLLAVLYQKPYTIPVKRTPVAISENVLKKYVGTYEMDDRSLIIVVTIHEGLLIAQPYQQQRPGPTSVMLAVDDKRFYDRYDEETEIAIEVDSTGKIKGMKIIQPGKTRWATKIK